MAENTEETLDSLGGYEDVMGEVARLRDELSNYEPKEERYGRGTMEADLYSKVMMRLAGQSPAVRANVYLSIGLAYEMAPELMTDLEVFVYAFGTQDHQAMEAVERGQVQAVEYGDVDNDGVLVDEDWYEDHIHHHGNSDEAQDYLADLFDADEGKDKSGFLNWALGMGTDDSREADDVWKAIESGLTADRTEWTGLKTGGDTALNNMFGMLDFISHASAVIAPVMAISGATTAVKHGLPRLNTMAVPTGVGTAVPVPAGAPAGQALSYGFRRAGIATAGARGAVASRPNWMRPIAWASSRIGQPVRRVIVNASASSKPYKSIPGSVAERMTRTSMSRRTTIGVGALIGGVPLTVAAFGAAGDKVQQGEEEIRDERIAKDERAQQVGQARANAGTEEAVLRRETERREQAREMYP